eukprot:scaffold10980_cov125-Isochrysis_galbana.AAC.3
MVDDIGEDEREQQGDDEQCCLHSQACAYPLDAAVDVPKCAGHLCTLLRMRACAVCLRRRA